MKIQITVTSPEGDKYGFSVVEPISIHALATGFKSLQEILRDGSKHDSNLTMKVLIDERYIEIKNVTTKIDG